MDPRRALGTYGEHIAERRLAEQGALTIARNARTRFGEIDLVCRDRSGYVFVEVKTRRDGSFVSALEAADVRKRRRLARLALAWLAARRDRAAPWRLVIAAVTIGPAGSRVELVPLDRF